MGQPATIRLGDTINLALSGHSAANGAAIPEGSTVTATSSDGAVAEAPAFSIPAGGAPQVVMPVAVLAVGSTLFEVTVVTPGGQTLTDNATLTVEAVGEDIVRVSLDLVP